MGRPIPTFLKFSQNTGAAPPNTDNYYIMPEHSFVTMKTAVISLCNAVLGLLADPTSKSWSELASPPVGPKTSWWSPPT